MKKIKQGYYYVIFSLSVDVSVVCTCRLSDIYTSRMGIRFHEGGDAL